MTSAVGLEHVRGCGRPMCFPCTPRPDNHCTVPGCCSLVCRIDPLAGLPWCLQRLSHVHGPHVVPNAGHSVMAESSELCNALINKFLLKRCKIQALK